MWIRTAVPTLLPLAVLVGGVASAAAQSSANFVDNCQRNRSDNVRVCETRNVAVPSVRSLNVDGRQNGGITVHAWDKNDIQVVAMVQAQAETEGEAQTIARQITISSANGQVQAEGPDTERRQSWSVSYEVWAPRATELTLTAHNGGISVDGIEARMNLQTTNGGLDLRDVSGDVHGVTTNGGITADLGGDRWRGNGLDLRTSNGGVELRIPSNYSAMLETGTVHGDLDIRIPITVPGLLGRQISTQLGAGGPVVRAMTTNGGVSIRPR
jgi:DUF4097 and DUF4098 domain-containing protein YvlB